MYKALDTSNLQSADKLQCGKDGTPDKISWHKIQGAALKLYP